MKLGLCKELLQVQRAGVGNDKLLNAQRLLKEVLAVVVVEGPYPASGEVISMVFEMDEEFFVQSWGWGGGGTGGARV